MSGRLRSAARAAGYAATPLFALYNGALGLLHASLWHGSICLYYLLLSLLQGLLLAARSGRGNDAPPSRRGRHSSLAAVSATLLVMNLALTVPAALMVLDQRPVRMGLIPAIVSATYTTYKITAASIGLKRASGSIFDRALGLLRFVDALVSILVLQNTLLTTIDGAVTVEMLPLVAVSSAAILLMVLALSLLWFVRSVKGSGSRKITP